MRGRPGSLDPTELEWGVARGIATFRWLAWAWSVAVLVLTRDDLSRPAPAVALVGVAFAVTAAATEASIRRRRRLFHPAVVAAEVGLGALLLAADGWVYDTEHGQTFGSAWPVAGALMAGVVLGPFLGAIPGPVLGAGRWLGAGVAPFDGASALDLVSSTVLFTLAGAAAGAVMASVRRAEQVAAEARAREEVARTLHDGVLQTLAVVQRRSSDPDLAALAREQEQDLRAFLAGVGRPTARRRADHLGDALRDAARRVEQRDGIRVDLVLVDGDLPSVDATVAAAVAGAVREALTNAAKHGGAGRATVFVDVDGDAIFCSVKDDGCGFDPSATDEGMGTTASSRGRLAEVGGGAEVRSRPGAGTEVVLRAPRRARATGGPG